MNETLWTRWLSIAESRPERECIAWTTAAGDCARYTYSSLTSQGAGVARRLAEAGVKPGDVCALVIRHRKEFYPLYAGIEALGALPAVLAYPNPRLHPEKFRQGLAGMAARSGLDWILTERGLEPTVAPLCAGEQSTVRGLLFPLDWPAEAEDPGRLPTVPGAEDPDKPALLQHSSGTTGLQKAVVLSHRAVLRHLEAYGRAIDLSPVDRVVSWLPLYHDMGLIAAFHLPLATGVPAVQIDPFEWVLAPDLLLRSISDEGGTLSWLPNFAYNLLAERVHNEDLEGIRLDSVRLLVNCSEPVRGGSHEKFLRRFSLFGLNARALSACYAMAETTFAVTQTHPGEEPATAVVEGLARRAVSSGLPIEGCEVRIASEDGGCSRSGEIGEIHVRSEYLFDGYRNWPEKTAEAFRDGWFVTGDLGFQRQGQLFVVGRKKDLIIVAGKNVYPEDVEDALSGVAGVLPGRVVAFAADDDSLGTERVAVIVETPIEEAAGQSDLRRRIVEAGMAVDVTIGEVLLAPPRWLIKSSAGKPARAANRERRAELSDERMGVSV